MAYLGVGQWRRLGVAKLGRVDPRWRYPRVLETLQSRCSATRIVVEHGRQKVGKQFGVAGRPVVFLRQHSEQVPRLEVANVQKLAWKRVNR